MNKELLKRAGLIAGIVLVFLALSYAFVPEVLTGKVLNQSDISMWSGMAQESAAWNAEHPDDKTAWTEYLENVMKKRGSQWLPLYRACRELEG